MLSLDFRSAVRFLLLVRPKYCVGQSNTKGYLSKNVSTFSDTNYSLVFWISGLTGCPVFCLAALWDAEVLSWCPWGRHSVVGQVVSVWSLHCDFLTNCAVVVLSKDKGCLMNHFLIMAQTLIISPHCVCFCLTMGLWQLWAHLLLKLFCREFSFIN